MDSGLLSTLAALAGTVVGALSSLGSNWMTSRAQARAQRLAEERAKREDIYGRYMDVLARLYAAALNSAGEVDYTMLTEAYALSGRISLRASDAVVAAGDKALRFVVDLAIGQRRSPEAMRALMDDAEANVIGAFARACREELTALH
ncbi:MAG TPA: hypothetical protein PKD73_18350 [Burkholderiaceae bacterium]|jgi:hypothetical protein|nr:hypothetical protein [Burkholderiaceae bacterium]